MWLQITRHAVNDWTTDQGGGSRILWRTLLDKDGTSDYLSKVS